MPHLGLDDIWGPRIPPDLQDAVVQLQNDADFDYLPRHELFHKFQLEYLDLGDMLGDGFGVLWWMEATAEWAAHQVAKYLALHPEPPTLPPATADEANLYIDRLDEFLSGPSLRIDTWNNDSSSQRQYGAFILVEYLEERFGAGFIHDVWETIGAGDVTDMVGVIGSELGGAGSSWAAELPGFWRAADLLASSDGTEPFTGTEWPAGSTWPEGPVTADTVWRDHVAAYGLAGEGDPLSVLLGLDAARPQRVRVSLTDGVEASDSVVVAGGGAAFFDLVPQPAGSEPLPDPGTLRVDVSADTSQGGVSAQLQRFMTYPVSCGTIPVALEPSGSGATGTAIIDVDPACPFATLIVTSTDPNGATRRFDWTATYETGPNLLSDPGFESGDYTTAWSTFKPVWIPEDSFGILDTPTHRGAYAASLLRSEGWCDPEPSGYEQLVAVIPGTAYSGFVWLANYNWGSGGVFLQVTQPDGTVISEDVATPATLGEWIRLGVSFVATGDSVRFRVGLVGDVCSTRGFAIDDAALIEGTVGDLVNAGFDDGLDAWTIVGGGEGTVVPVTVGGDTAIQITPSTGQPVGVEQWFDGYGYNAASARVSVSGADSAQVTLEVLRLDGTLVDDSGSVSVSASQGWVTIGDVFWVPDSEDVLIYRITTTGSGDVLVDWILVGLAT